MSQSVKWGVLGSGGIARRRTIPEGIVPARNAELKAVYSRRSELNAEIAAEFNCRAAGSIEELLDSGIDSVYVATPNDLHHEQVLLCAQAEKHVLCEKPLGLNPVEAAEMISACRKQGVLLGTGFMMRFHAQHQAALKLIREGKLGQLTYGRAQLSCWYPPLEDAWRQDPARGGGGSLMDMGSHCIDLLEMFLGRVRKLSCFINTTIHSYRSEDSAVALLSFENGALATVDTFFCIPDASSKNALELFGARGSILARGTIGHDSSGQMLAFLEEEKAGYDAQQKRTASEGIPLAPEPVNIYRAEIEEFSQAIIEERAPLNNGRLGLHSQEILAACYESAGTGRIVEPG